MKAVFCEFLRKTCAYKKRQRTWLPELLAQEYRRRKLVKFVKFEGKPVTKEVGRKTSK